MVTNYSCDKCGESIDSLVGHTIEIPTQLEYFEGKVMCGVTKKIDLCIMCLEYLYVFLGINVEELANDEQTTDS